MAWVECEICGCNGEYSEMKRHKCVEHLASQFSYMKCQIKDIQQSLANKQEEIDRLTKLLEDKVVDDV